MSRKKRFPFLKDLVDFWSIPHFLFGAVTALIAIVFSIAAGTAFLSTLVLAILWELFEFRQGIVESPRNRMSDVLFPLVAFPTTYLFARNIAIGQDRRVSLLVIMTILFLYTNFMAWKARLSRDRDFMD